MAHSYLHVDGHLDLLSEFFFLLLGIFRRCHDDKPGREVVGDGNVGNNERAMIMQAT
jgi:hypothetical protein